MATVKYFLENKKWYIYTESIRNNYSSIVFK